ncbi:MAG: NAD(P)-dependent glycerol-3-phosphate dehydrogenase [Candidatus Thioglobus sp.]|jgi:glycerol-3-phosphate dehydrogenase (NAD(P)+)|uniref:NAD(P)H-dependent glycerol-3-phosphate dehydrogenase n=1 Tax=Candidatus Thioglobus sp. TaxID=2026721 RepID=UPI0001BD37A2|nr:NAD(P)H-dependent glycerol-3-phosphate dehydrogenase [Candidatus Thioglobus sp.]EEZ80063.1 MAG: glycerol-3-phosphate dehydrogenase [uncultured Candidatus Thioglobus sp.]MBT3186654.1 NAD(P)-dependent glycerol-3-phosphate dehydrogenase [Candidatus Thioglobus sp.]MBT3432248.1 NAD(P)-dependent glycerol-3-phosphate dehydrogenase [Candidatus Thioglobus sp.]MBT3964923.1 NAD(P)-dependent glycerol-3-phosphate dehydrogenase [Candidatus Thioglobus sp.]MBT4316399.1 NAD(P)-dependent glycerol-3-phosphate
MANLSILGSGAWGSALSIALSDNFEKIYLHAYTEEEAKSLSPKHPALSVNYPDNVELTSDLSPIQHSQSVLIAVPSYGFGSTLETIQPLLTSKHNVAWVTKGFDTDKGRFLHESFEAILNDHFSCAISGPSFAFEVATRKPTALTVASLDKNTRDYWSKALHTKTLRTYTNEDIIGVEVGGSLKNILAIAAGIAAGLGFGANTQAALITRGLAEMIRLGKSLGAHERTFNGLSGLGDLVLTCSDDLSRNRRFGKELANNQSVEQALDNVGATVEGLNTLELVLSIAKKNKVELPICEQVYQVTQGNVTPTQAVTQLMLRDQIKE